jgi:hypothetical protein
MSTSRILTRGARTINVANDVEAKVEAIGDLPIKLKDGFTLQLHDVVYVPSLSRNLISVSCLADYGFECQFTAQHCSIKLNNMVVSLAIRQDKLYMLAIHDNSTECVDYVCENANVVSSTNVSKKRKQIDSVSSKLWHCRLGHISRGRMERLVKESILPPLEFNDLEQCIDCIKGKFVK